MELITMTKNWKTINRQKYDPEIMGNFIYLGKHFKHKMELINNENIQNN